MSRPTEKDIKTDQEGWYVLPCDGTCAYEVPFHRYLYYPKKEVISLWRRTHPARKKK